GDRVRVTSLMGAGVDPHLYKASERDAIRLAEADIVFYNGLHLEGKMGKVFERMRSRVRTVAVSKDLTRTDLIENDDFEEGHDPHIWFDVTLWMKAAATVRDALIDLDPNHKQVYLKNHRDYLQKLEELDAYVRKQVNRLSDRQRQLVTAHDAFSYFARTYGFQVHGLQGISTATEAGTRDVQKLAQIITESKIRAIFVESS